MSRRRRRRLPRAVSETFKIAVIGAGPGGMSAAARAAELGVPHVLLEQSGAHANTIQRYQKGKHVMAEPNVLPLRSSLEFAAGVREAILDRWSAGLEQPSREHAHRRRSRRDHRAAGRASRSS